MRIHRIEQYTFPYLFYIPQFLNSQAILYYSFELFKKILFVYFLILF